MRMLFRALAVCLSLLAPLAWAGKQTVCTITINSADEQKTFRKYLSPDKYEFVELVERGRKDWLASACQAKVSCDVLVISGHHGEGNVFFSDALDINEHLDIEELERVSCSNSCPKLFANLKEVYLFGCNTLNPQPQLTASEEIQRSLLREGRNQMDAAQLAKRLGLQRGESSRDRMRMVFPQVPVIYGFSSVAPLGPVAAVSLNRYFQQAGPGEVGKGRASASLLRNFAQHSMVSTRGMAESDPLMPLRRDICNLADDGATEAKKVDAIHEMMRRPIAESRLLLDRIERFMATLDTGKRASPAVAQALEGIARDTQVRDRYMAFARDADQLPVRARMIQLAQGFGWLSAEDRRKEIVATLGDMVARKEVGAAEVNLACKLNEQRELDGALQQVAARASRPDAAGPSAVLACLGSTEARNRVLENLVSTSDAEVQVAQAYLRQRPIADAAELRGVTRAITRMSAPEAQVRALDTLGRHYLNDRESVATLKELFARTKSAAVQNAIAGVLIRADRRSVSAADMLPTLREHRLSAARGDSMVDALIARLQQIS
ncbi:hypothetical protein [Ramlibacter sp. PS4R-6]|uniref:hypothetical protein n=1 Tax=Ramlibacter sp. PS4R-6 TaxID=3133438 RepID=UPI00309A5427